MLKMCNFYSGRLDAQCDVLLALRRARLTTRARASRLTTRARPHALLFVIMSTSHLI